MNTFGLLFRMFINLIWVVMGVCIWVGYEFFGDMFAAGFACVSFGVLMAAKDVSGNYRRKIQALRRELVGDT